MGKNLRVIEPVRAAFMGLCLTLVAAAPLPGDGILPKAAPLAARRGWMARQSALCLTAINEAADRNGLPRGLMTAISRVETGRPMPVTGERQPWPWTVNADGEGLFFDTRAAAVAETTRRLAHGAKFVDIGCMQVDVRVHAKAFATLAEAFNPMTNADYAARLLISLRGGSGIWKGASGLYHSGTPALGDPYRAKVGHMAATQRDTLSRAIPGS